MERRDRAPEAIVTEPSWTFRYVAICLGLVALSFLQAPGRIVADTKLDLVVDPQALLARAATIWDPNGFLGQLQNQAYGYLFPMGSFFAAGDLVALDPWVVQRLWWSLLLCAAFLGVVVLARALGIGSPGAQVVGALAYALSPRMLSVIGPSSIEVWPMALAPWVLVPLVVGMRGRSPRRMAALSALAVACVGGVNAAATFAVVPLAALWLLFHRGPRRATMLRWWPPLVLVGTAWWIGPLLLLGQYSPPFLDFIESASVTTRLASVDAAVRGVTNWVPAVSTNAVAGAHFFNDPIVMIDAALLMGAGLVGLTLPGLVARRFLILGVMMGLFLVTLGFLGSVSGVGAVTWQSWLDGFLAPLRNTHKFDVLIRIPLVLGLVHLVTVVGGSARTRLERGGFVLGLTAVLVGATSPAWSSQLAPRGSFEEIPGYWREATDWVDARVADEGVLLVPSAPFGDFLWGSAGDEPWQALSATPWIVRNSVPLTPPGTIRLLDAVTSTIAQGRAQDHLAETLARSGVRYVVLRNDLRQDVVGARASVARQTLVGSEDVEPVAAFGPRVGGGGTLDIDGVRHFSQGGWTQRARAVEIYRVLGAQPERSRLDTVVGSAGDLPALRAGGALPGDAVLASDVREGESPPGRLVLTDGLRPQEAAFGAVDRTRSATLLPGEHYSLDRRVHDYVSPEDRAWTVGVRLEGARSLRASSSRSQAAQFTEIRTDASPWAAFDGGTATAWRPAGSSGWLDLTLDEATVLERVTLRAGLPPGETQTATVRTEEGPVTLTMTGNEAVVVRPGLVGSVRVTLERAAGSPQLADVHVAGVDVTRVLDLPNMPAQWGSPDVVVSGAGSVHRPGCVELGGVTRCRSGREDLSEDAGGIERTAELGAGPVAAQLEMRAISGDALDSLLQADYPATVTTSSTVTKDAGSSSSQMLDGSSGTAWTAAPGDVDPTIVVDFDETRTFDELTLRTADGVPASRVASVVVIADGVQRAAEVEAGVARLPDPMTASTVEVHLVSAEDARDFREDGAAVTLPVGVSEFDISGALPRLDREASVIARCEDPSPLTLGEREVAVEGTTTVGHLLAGGGWTLSSCGTAEAPEGRTAFALHGTASLIPMSVQWSRAASAPPPSGPLTQVLRHNANPGWTDPDGAAPVVVNGWQQGFAGASPVTPEFAPFGPFRWTLGVGAAGAALLLALTFVLRGGRMLPQARIGWGQWASAGAAGLLLVLTGGAAGGIAAALGALIAGSRSWWCGPTAVCAAGVLVSSFWWVMVDRGEFVSGAPAQLAMFVALGGVARSLLTRR